MWFNKEAETLIEYKKYDKSDSKQKELSMFPAIEHYKDSNIEWYSVFDENDNEIECDVIVGNIVRIFTHKWTYSEEKTRWVRVHTTVEQLELGRFTIEQLERGRSHG